MPAGRHGRLYLWGLGAPGWANSFYSAAVQAGAHSWRASFFGSSDAARPVWDHRPVRPHADRTTHPPHHTPGAHGDPPDGG